MHPVRRLSLSLLAAFVAAACSTEPPDPFAGNWTSRVLLVTSSGVPLADSGVTTTVTLALSVSGATISGTASGVFSGAMSVSGNLVSDSIHVVIAMTGSPYSQAAFDGHVAAGVMPGTLLRIGQDVSAHPLMFSRP